MSVEIARHSFTVEEYERMGEAGVFAPDARLELIEGDIFEIPPVTPLHAGIVNYLGWLFHRGVSDWMVSLHNPVRLNNFSEPLPDIKLLRRREDFYRNAHPAPEDVLLVIEVADTTVETDRKVKIPLYARAGIPEAWIVNIPEERIEIYSDPEGESYGQIKRFGRGRRTRSQTLEGFGVGVDEVLG